MLGVAAIVIGTATSIGTLAVLGEDLQPSLPAALDEDLLVLVRLLPVLLLRHVDAPLRLANIAIAIAPSTLHSRGPENRVSCECECDSTTT